MFPRGLLVWLEPRTAIKQAWYYWKKNMNIITIIINTTVCLLKSVAKVHLWLQKCTYGLYFALLQKCTYVCILPCCKSALMFVFCPVAKVHLCLYFALLQKCTYVCILPCCKSALMFVFCQYGRLQFVLAKLHFVSQCFFNPFVLSIPVLGPRQTV